MTIWWCSGSVGVAILMLMQPGERLYRGTFSDSQICRANSQHGRGGTLAWLKRRLLNLLTALSLLLCAAAVTLRFRSATVTDVWTISFAVGCPPERSR